MSLFSPRGRRAAAGEANLKYYGVQPRSGGGRGNVAAVTNDTALRHDAVWACTTIRRDLISTFPVDVFRNVGDVRIEVPKSPFIRQPGGPRWGMRRWLSATQFDLDRAGNAIGLITEVNAMGLPSRVELQDISKCAVIKPAGKTELIYRINGKEYAQDKVWHEVANPVAGLEVGLSPIAYAAWKIGEYLSIEDFAIDWFAGAGIPKARLKNNKVKIDDQAAGIVKDRWKASVRNGDLFVHGVDWEYDLMQAEAMGSEWLDAQRYSLAAICRYFRCPADLIDAAISSPGTLTYQSALSRNLQFLTMQLQPSIVAREEALSETQPTPRYVKMNTGSLLRMTPEQQAAVIHQRIEDRTLTVTEGRALYDLAPLTPEQEAEFERLFGPAVKAPAGKTQLDATLRWGGASNVDDPVQAIATIGVPGEIEWKVPS